MTKSNSTLRIARPTDHLIPLSEMYISGLGFELLGSFDDHDGFSGRILGHPESTYHLEFTSEDGVTAGRAPTKDNLLVFYVPQLKEWEAQCAKIASAGFTIVPALNPYWDQNGRTFEDLDGYRVVIKNCDWHAIEMAWRASQATLQN